MKNIPYNTWRAHSKKKKKILSRDWQFFNELLELEQFKSIIKLKQGNLAQRLLPIMSSNYFFVFWKNKNKALNAEIMNFGGDVPQQSPWWWKNNADFQETHLSFPRDVFLGSGSLRPLLLRAPTARSPRTAHALAEQDRKKIDTKGL